MHTTTAARRARGFATMSPERRSEIARLGGQAAHRLGVGHEWTPAEARIAGKKGGTISRRGPKKASLPE